MPTIEIQFDKKFDKTKVLREVDARCRFEYLCLTLLGAMFVLGALFYAWQQYRWIQYGYRIEALQQQIEALEETGRLLRIEQGELANLERINAIARGRLGMVPTLPGQIVTFGTDAPMPVRAEPPETLVAENR